MVKENLIPKTETVYELKNEVPSFEEFMKTYEENKGVSDSYESEIKSHGDIGVAKGYGPMLRYHSYSEEEKRDAARRVSFRADFSSTMNHWAYRGLFQFSDGVIRNDLELRGIDEMRRGLRQLENGEIKVVRTIGGYNSLNYERFSSREELVKNELREMIRLIENGSLDNSYYNIKERTDKNGEKILISEVSTITGGITQI